MAAEPPRDTLEVALAQAPLAWQAPGDNFAALRRLVGERASGADLVVLPEMFPTGFTMTPGDLPESTGPRAREFLSAEATRTGAYYLGSTPYHLPERGGYVNRMLLVGPDGSVAHYDKRHRFAMAGERDAYLPGDAHPVVVDVHGWRILLQVCYDLRFPVFSRNRASGAGAYDVAVYVANWPSPRRAHWKALLRARAIENQAYVFGVNRVGSDGNGLDYAGDTRAYGPAGDLDLDLGAATEVGRVSLTRRRLLDVRQQLPFLADADGFALPEAG